MGAQNAASRLNPTEMASAGPQSINGDVDPKQGTEAHVHEDGSHVEHQVLRLAVMPLRHTKVLHFIRCCI
jgi:hypothetical protein